MEGIYAFADQIKVYKAILDSTQEIQNYLRYHSVNVVASKNAFGKQQRDVDIKADEIIEKHLKTSQVVAACASEERPERIELNKDGSYYVTYDPIDGTSVIDCNFSVGSIFGIWATNEIEGKTGRDLVGAALAIYGTRCTILIYNTQSGHVEELTLMKIGKKEKWIVTNPKIELASQAKLFSISSQGVYDNPALWQIYEEYIVAGFSLRHSGCAALDFNQIFVKKQGLYVTLHSIAHPSKLSLLYEICPLAFLVEKSGGKAVDGIKDCLDIEIKGFQQKVNMIAGSKEDVDYVSQKLNEDENNASGAKGSYNDLLSLQEKMSPKKKGSTNKL